MNVRTLPLLACLSLAGAMPVLAQDLPDQMYFTPDGHRIRSGGLPSAGLYQKDLIRTVDLTFTQSNYWSLLTTNYNSNIDLAATMVVDGVTYNGVGVQFKGQTSYSMLPGTSQKKSFGVSMDFTHDSLDLMGYQTLNFNNAFEDPSFLREVVYLELIRDHVPAAQANFIHLNINGASWGLYPNVQQINSDFVKQWWFSNDGILWRADRPTGMGSPGWGDGTAAFNNLGPDTTTYKTYYTLKRSEQVQPWDKLVLTCQKLNLLPSGQLADSIDKYIDLDRTLWFLASEIAFSDDDSYVYKGKMDYYHYWDVETGRMTPQEFDGNSVMKNNAVNWSPFYHADNANYPLLNKLLVVPSIRQRYLAHMRTIISEKMQSSNFNALIADYNALINAEVQADPKKLYTYTAYTNELTYLQNFITNRRNNLLANSEVAQVAPVISNTYHSVNGTQWQAPVQTDSPLVRTTVTSTNGISSVTLYYSNGLYGRFSKMPMYDDGAHDDGAAGDGVYAANLPASNAASYMRYYVQAAANNAALSVSYDPVGAEHDTYVYQVTYTLMTNPPVRINELMAQNTVTVMDNYGEYSDWVELFNTTGSNVDLSGGWLSDELGDIYKWQFPEGSVIPGNGYMIVWADDDGSQGDNHAGFKLTASGEQVWLTAANGEVMDQITFGEQVSDQGFARVPNGTGPFVIQEPTFNANNNTVAVVEEIGNTIHFAAFPNPVRDQVTLTTDAPVQVVVYDALARRVWEGRVVGRTTIDAFSWDAGSYTVRHEAGAIKLLVTH